MRRLVAILMLFAAACSNGADPEPSATTESPTSTTASAPSTTASIVPDTTAATTATTSTSMAAIPADAPSQTAADAARDGVVPEIADLTPQQRVQPLFTVETAEGTWVASVLTDAVINESMADGCAIGDSTGRYGVDFVCSVEYGEFVLADERGEIVKAYPLPGAKPSWLHVTDTWVYGGRIGDGGLPDSTVIRINRSNLSAVVVVLPAPFDGGSSWPPGWFVATPDQIEPFAPMIGQQGDFDGLLVDAWHGPVVVDLELIDAFLEQFVESG